MLEVGCGGGYVSYCLAEHYNCDVTGIDIYESEHWEDLKHNNLKFKAVDLSVANPFEDNSFDLVVSYVAWEHMRHPFKVLQECTKIIKTKQGNMFISANLYRSPIASHLYRHIFFPWPHLIFDDEIIVEYALSQGVEQWWIDAFYYVNKLTYSEYKEYFKILNLKIINEKLNYSKFDKEFYNRFEDKLGLYPIYDLEINFFNVLLSKQAEIKEYKRLNIEEVKLNLIIDSENNKKLRADCISSDESISYAFYLYKDDKIVEKKMYTSNSYTTFNINEKGFYYIKAFIKDLNNNKTSAVSEKIEIT